MKSLAFIFLFAITQYSQAHTCRGALISDDHILDRNVRQQIAEQLAEYTSDAGRWKNVSDLYIQARLNLEPAADRPLLKNEMHRVSTEFVEGAEFVANAAKIKLPKEFEDTPLPAFIEAHEREHRIQMYRENPADNSYVMALFAARYLMLPKVRYVTELEAMRAEWEIISVVTDHEAERTMEIVKASALSPSTKKFFLRALSNRKLSRNSYVHAEHEAGRYSYGEIFADSAGNWATAGFLGSCMYPFIHHFMGY